jgi:hypothetical protein
MISYSLDGSLPHFPFALVTPFDFVTKSEYSERWVRQRQNPFMAIDLCYHAMNNLYFLNTAIYGEYPKAFVGGTSDGPVVQHRAMFARRE